MVTNLLHHNYVIYIDKFKLITTFKDVNVNDDDFSHDVDGFHCDDSDHDCYHDDDDDDDNDDDDDGGDEDDDD